MRDDERFVRDLVARLTRRHEAGEPRPWRMTDSAPEYIDDMPGRIVGIEVAVTALVGKAKLSQNKEPSDRLAVADTLAGRGHEELARRMRAAGCAEAAAADCAGAAQRVLPRVHVRRPGRGRPRWHSGGTVLRPSSWPEGVGAEATW